jgi:sulfur-oxidizing protein SoxZ
MSKENGRIRVKSKDGGIAVRAILRHPMETGSRKDPATGEAIPRHYIQQVVCEQNGEVVLTWDWGWGVSANPYLAFHIQQGRSGDVVLIRWTDDRGETGSLEATVA